jgi:hypothetical protein
MEANGSPSHISTKIRLFILDYLDRAQTTDWWAGHVERELGAGYGKLLQLYGVHKAQAEAKRKGYTTRRQQLGDGSIKLTIGGV